MEAALYVGSGRGRGGCYAKAEVYTKTGKKKNHEYGGGDPHSFTCRKRVKACCYRNIGQGLHGPSFFLEFKRVGCLVVRRTYLITEHMRPTRTASAGGCRHVGTLRRECSRVGGGTLHRLRVDTPPRFTLQAKLGLRSMRVWLVL